MLSAEDLAYMRATQAEARPTPADLRRRTQSTSGSGGRTDTWADPEPIQVRLDANETDVPPAVVATLGSTPAVKIVMDMVEVHSGDAIAVGSEVYQVITDQDPDAWTTAQVVWAKRLNKAPW